MVINEQEVITGAPTVKYTDTWEAIHHYVNVFAFKEPTSRLANVEKFGLIFKDSRL